MSKEIDHDARYSAEDIEYLESRGQYGRIEQNARIYGKIGDPEPEEPGRNPESENTKEAIEAAEAAAEAARKSVVGEVAPVPEPQVVLGSGGLSAADSPKQGSEDEDGEIDDDIAEHAQGLTVAELKAKLGEAEVEFDSKAKHDDLAIEYANYLQDQRDEGETVDLSDGD